MTERLRHRGPDDDGLLDRTPLAVLGHRRLSIIDVAHGHQPMATADERLWITYNGEIYNFASLRSELEAKGHRFTTHCDTEVALLAYREWGEACVERFEGMFAFAILDLDARRLVLARDHLGKKPLYLRWRNGVLDFASELHALAAAGDWRGDRDPLATAFFLRLGYVPSPWTAFRGVEKLRPGEICVIDASGLRKRRYWLPEPGEPNRSPDEVLRSLEEAVERAVAMRLVSEVPLGAFLSGGIDSGLVVGRMAALCGPGVKTTTIGFEGDPTGGELGAARAIARHHRTDHAELVVRPDAAAILPDLDRHFGEPFADSSAIPAWYVSRETRRRVTVALSGDGGDEAFGGYDFRYGPHARDARLRGACPAAVRSRLFGLLARSWPVRHSLPRWLRLQTVFRNLAVEEDEAFYLDLCFTKPEVADRLAPALARYGKDVEEHVRSLYRSCRGEDALQSIMLADARFYLPEDVLVKVDRMSMAHSLEVRSPLLAKHVVELAFSIPSAWKWERGTSKAILRRLAARDLPAEVQRLPKRGFHAPIGEWLRGPLREAFESDVLRNAPAGCDGAALAQLWGEHRSGAFDHGAALWAVWTLRRAEGVR